MILDFFDYYSDKESRIERENGFFKTMLDYPICKESNINRTEEADLNIEATKDFQQAIPPKFIEGDLSLKIPIEINQVKLNASKNNEKSKFNVILNEPDLKDLNILIDAMISDAFWFIVISFRQFSWDNQNRRSSDYRSMSLDMQKRLSMNYFKFFIKLCDENKKIMPDVKKTTSKNKHVIKNTFNKDTILDYFHDFMSQSVFYSLYLSFPKSRGIFNNDFKHFLISFFGYLFNGLSVHNKYNIDHWELDLGSGDIIENENDFKNISNFILFRGAV